MKAATYAMELKGQYRYNQHSQFVITFQWYFICIKKIVVLFLHSNSVFIIDCRNHGSSYSCVDIDSRFRTSFGANFLLQGRGKVSRPLVSHISKIYEKWSVIDVRAPFYDFLPSTMYLCRAHSRPIRPAHIKLQISCLSLSYGITTNMV